MADVNFSSLFHKVNVSISLDDLSRQAQIDLLNALLVKTGLTDTILEEGQPGLIEKIDAQLATYRDSK